MDRRQLAGLIAASALITLDGTAATIALPAIGRELSAAVWRLQWIGNAPLLAMTALLLPAGALADRYGRVWVIRAGLLAFVAGSLACAVARSDTGIIVARFVQGAGGALILPAVLAVLRGSYDDASERARMFGVWAAWTGAASALGPLLAGALVDLWSWRAVFVPSAAAGLAAFALLRADVPAAAPSRTHRLPTVATLAMVVVLGGLAYLLMEGPALDKGGWKMALAAGPTLFATAVLLRDPERHLLLPPELLTARNCLPANAATFAFYFGMFGLSFVVVLYAQQALGYSALWTALALLPVSIMLLFAERLGRLAPLLGTRWTIVLGSLCAAAGIWWIAAAPHPLRFWSHLIAGTSAFGLGISLAVSALTHAAVAAVPDKCAGAASGLNHAIVRAAGLTAIALLGSLAAPGVSDAVSAHGVRTAMMVCAAVVAAGACAAAIVLRDGEPGGLTE